jgi:hypothetical protein
MDKCIYLKKKSVIKVTNPNSKSHGLTGKVIRVLPLEYGACRIETKVGKYIEWFDHKDVELMIK